MEKTNSNQDNTNLKLNGDQNLGRLVRFIFIENIPSKYHTVLIGIARMSIGYCQPMAIRKNKTGMTAIEWASFLGISDRSFRTQVKELEELGYVSITPGSHFRQDGGSYPNTYGINFTKTKEAGIYFNLDGVRLTNFTETKEEIKEEDNDLKKLKGGNYEF